MKNKLILVLMVFSLLVIDYQYAWSQLNTENTPSSSINAISSNDQLVAYFQEAYERYPELPDGLLEAMSFNTTRLKHRIPNESISSCSGTPHIYGVMALVKDGKGLINNTLYDVAAGSSYGVDELINSPRKNILASAEYLARQGRARNLSKTDIKKWIPIIEDFIGIPDESEIARFLKDNFIWVVLRDMANGIHFKGTEFSRANESVQPASYFEEEKLKMLQQKVVSIEAPSSDQNFVPDSNNDDQEAASQDYSGADWVPSSCYSSRNGAAITDVVIHDMEGYFTYTTYTLFHNCNAQVSAHYCLRSSDGYIVQLVRESDKAWHVGGANSYSIGLEHEGFANDASWYTDAMYNSSAALVKDITQSGYGISPTTCYNGPSNTAGQIDPQPTSVRIKGHCHYPLSINSNGHWDPGPNWDWPHYYNLINGSTGGGNCPSTKNLSGTIPNGTHQASSSITSNGTVISSRNITFRSPTIRLNGGFKVNLGGAFKTISAGCTSNKPEPTAAEVVFEENHLAHRKKQVGENSIAVIPNPFQENARVQFELKESSNTSIVVMDARGQIITRLVDNVFFEKGKQELAFQLSGLANGYYFFVLQTAKERKVVNVAILK